MQRYLIIIFLCVVYNLSAQVEDAWVYFKDKQEVQTYLNAPETMLSQKALERRLRNSIALDFYDIPISTQYVNEVRSTSGIQILATSKWLNAVHVQGEIANINSLLQLASVQKIEFLNANLNGKSIQIKNHQKKSKFLEIEDLPYGYAANQIEMLRLQTLHEKGLLGQGMTIAVMDAGFPGVNTIAAFDSIHKNKQLKGGYNFVDRNSNVYSRHPHGTSVLSTMAGYIKDTLIGTAPKADYYLFVTEDYTREHPVEESLWIEAAEMADSLGVDIINTSLGYNTFDNPNYNYDYEDLDGATSFISKGAEIAASRGILVVNSAGNEGANSWKYVTAPADAPSVLAIGAVNNVGEIASFSSVGPTYDQRLKPDLVAQGSGVLVIRGDGTKGFASGTSFSSPILAGAMACLWQANRDISSFELVELTKQSASKYHSPNMSYGYGIPNFNRTYQELTKLNAEVSWALFPNPVSSVLTIELEAEELPTSLKVFSIFGELILEQKITEEQSNIDVQFLNTGVYIFNLDNVTSHKIIKI